MSRALSFLMLLWIASLAACADGLGLGSTHPSSAVTVTSVTPYNGPLAGGTTVMITGTNFPARIDSVRIGTGRLGNLVHVSQRLGNYSWVSTTMLTGTVPSSGSMGAVDVTVYAGGGSGTCSGCFTYKPPVTWIDVAAGTLHTCGLTTGGRAYCWGRTFDGQLGLGFLGYGSFSTPAAVLLATTFASLTAGSDHTCALTSGGAAYCWGLNSDGRLGLGDAISRATPVAVVGGLAFASLTAGDAHTCGLTSSGAAYCWGGNFGGPTPVAVTGGIAFASLAAGSDHTCGLTGAGKAFCWGGNGSGQLGLGHTLATATPTAVAGGITFASLTAGYHHTCGLTSDGTAYCWGNNDSGQLGDGTTPAYSPDGHSLTDRSTPVAVTGGLTFSRLTASFDRTFGLAGDGVAYSWGWQPSGTISLTPVAIAGGLAFTRLTSRDVHACGLTSGGTAYCWGSNNFGQLGDGSYTTRTAPVAVASP